MAEVKSELPQGFRDAKRAFPFFLAYFAAHFVAFLFPDTQTIMMVVWPAGGIGLAALLMNPRRLWPTLLVGFFITGNLADFSIGRPALISMGFMGANILESLACAFFIDYFLKSQTRFSTVKDILALLLAATVVNAFSALIGAGTAYFFEVGSFWELWKNWWVADGLGILIITPLIVTFPHVNLKISKIKWKWGLELLLYFVCWFVLADEIFKIHPVHSAFTPHPYLLLVLLCWGALRFGIPGTALSVCLLALVAVESDAINLGPFLWGGDTIPARIITCQIFIAFMAGMGFLLAASYSQAKQAERRAVQESERITFLSDNLQKGVIFQTLRYPDGKCEFLYIGRGIKKLIGIEASDVLKNPNTLYDLVLPEDAEKMRERKVESKKSGTSITQTVRMLPDDGRLRWMQISSVPKKIGGGKVIWDGLLLDITENKIREQELEESEQKFRALIEASAQIVWTANPDGTIFEDSPSWRAFTGQTLIETQENRHLECVHPDDKEEVKNKWAKALSMGWPVQMTYRLRHHSGEWRWTNESRVPLKDDEGNIKLWVGMNTDIHGQKTAEEALQKLAKEMETILATLTVGVSLVRNRKVVWANQAHDDLFGYTEEERSLLDTSKFYAGLEEYEQVGIEGYPKMMKGESYSREVRMRRRDGSLFWCQITGRAVDPGNYDAGSIWMLQDVSEQKRMGSELERTTFNLERAQSVAEIGSWHLNIPQNKLEWSKETFRIFDVDPGTKMGLKFFLTKIHPDDREKVQEHWEKALAGGQYDIEHRIVTGSEVTWVREKARIVRDEHGNPYEGIGTVQNISERKKLEMELLKSEKKYRFLFDSTQDGILIFDDKKSILEVNQGACRLLGYTYDDFFKISFDKIQRESLENNIFDSIQKEHDQEICIFKTIFLKKDATNLHVQVSAHKFSLKGKPAMIAIFKCVDEDQSG